MHDAKMNILSRRNIIGMSAGLAPLFGGVNAFAIEADARTLNRLDALVKMRGSLDGRVGFAWIKGIRYAQVGGRLEPMCGVLNCTINRYERLSADSFDLRLYEMSFYTDLADGQYRPTLTMPFSGKTVDVPLYRTGPGQHVVKTANREEMSWSKSNTTSEAAARQLAPDGKIFYAVELSQPTIQGDHVWLTTEATTRLVPNDPAERPWFYKELITNHGSLNALLNQSTPFVDSQSTYTLMMGWRPWMQMGDIEGHTLDHAIGGRVWKIEDLPAEILDHIRLHHPDVAKNPQQWLEAKLPSHQTKQ